MLDGRLQYRLATTRDGVATPAAVALVAKAKAEHIVVVADGAELKLHVPHSCRGSLLQQLAVEAPDVLAVLQQQSAQRIGRSQPGPEDAESASAWAEGYLAMKCVRVVPAWAALRPGTWAALIDAAGQFLDRWGRQAAALGWDAIDLFGALPGAPLVRIDQQGLVFFLRAGCSVVAMTADTATIRRPSGVVQTFRRPHKNARAPRTAPVWELVTGGGGGL
jgi:hypothetical protein